MYMRTYIYTPSLNITGCIDRDLVLILEESETRGVVDINKRDVPSSSYCLVFFCFFLYMCIISCFYFSDNLQSDILKALCITIYEFACIDV